MAKFRLTERCFVKANGTAEAWLYEAGSIVEIDGIPPRNSVPLDDEARAKIAEIPALNTMAKNLAVRRGDPPPSE